MLVVAGLPPQSFQVSASHVGVYFC